MPRHEPQPDPGPHECNDVTHDADCGCGARPDYEYERRMED